jgi:inner membrane protein
MDPLSQAVVGSLAAGSVATRPHLRKALLAGALGGMVADLDVLIRSADDPLLNIEYHRHFTHALAFIPLGGLLTAVFLWPFLRRGLGFGRVYLFCTLGYATSGLLDACTSYGTHLLWPFSDARTAWNIIAIVDPVFTGTLILGAVVAALTRRRLWGRLAGLAGLAYLGFGVVQNHRATAAVEDLAAHRRHDAPTLVAAKPAIGTLLLWRGLYAHEGRLYIDAWRLPYVGGAPRLYEGASVPLLDLDELLEGVPTGSALEEDLRRFALFSARYLIRHPEHPEVIADARYALLPDSPLPLWGIVPDPATPGTHAEFRHFREITDERLERFKAMLRGQDTPADSAP